ncbi:hypothetical protein Y032_1344g3836, partial [Ancylostoma ceylanicum]
MSSSTQTFTLKTVKAKLTRQLNTLGKLIQEAEQFQEPWTFPEQITELQHFLSTKTLVIKNIICKLEEQKEAIWNCYNECNCTIAQLTRIEPEEGSNFEASLDQYWEERQGETILQQTTDLVRKLDLRKLELDCQAASLRGEFTSRNSYKCEPNEIPSMKIGIEPIVHPECTTTNRYTLERRLLGSELRVPEFSGDPTEFDSFWELFEELVHKQPFTNIEKLSILLSCCKGDANRALKMIPRTGDSYETAIKQLKDQYQDPKRMTMTLIRQLQSLKQSRDDPRSLRNTLNDVQAIVTALTKQGETIDTTYMINIVIDIFSRSIQNEITKKEFDSGKTWTMSELLENISTIIRRREHLELRKTSPERSEFSTFHTKVDRPTTHTCIGCGKRHKFKDCLAFPTPFSKVERMKTIQACWKCFNRHHQSIECTLPNCPSCGGCHAIILCRSWQRRRQPNSSSHTRSQWRWSHRQRTPSTSRSRQPNPKSIPQKKNYTSQTNSRYHTPAGRSGNHKRTRDFYNNYQSPRSSHSSSLNRRTPARDNSTPRVRFRRSPTPITTRTVNYTYNQDSFPDTTEIPMPSSSEEKHNTGRTRLMTIPIQIRNLHSGRLEEVWALLDSASDQSFIMDSLVQHLGLPVQTESHVTITTFGGRAERKKTHRVNLTLYNYSGEEMEVSLLSFDRLTSTIFIEELSQQDREVIQLNYPQFEFGETSQQIEPNILIGMDYFNTIMKLNQPILQLPSGLVVQDTFFGPLISGTTRETSTENSIF